jgi:hypothetical protein
VLRSLLVISKANGEPNGEPKLMVILFMAGLCEASRGTGMPLVRKLIRGGRAWQRNAGSR